MFKQIKTKYEIVIVDDNSEDNTGVLADILQSHFCEKEPNTIQVLHRAGKLGLGTAYMDGLKLCSGTHVIIMDSDLSHQVKYIPQFIK